MGTYVDVEEKVLRGGGRVLMRTERDALIPALCSMEALSGDRRSMFIKHPNAHNVGPARWLHGVRASYER